MNDYNLGCGEDIKDGFINWDKGDLDLDKPFSLEKPNIVYLRSIMEHLHNPKECIDWICESNAKKIIIDSPTFSPIIQHRLSLINSNSFNYIGIYKGYKKIRVNREFDLKVFLEHIKNFFESIIFSRIRVEFKKIN